MSNRFELVNFLNAHDNFRDNENNKKLDSFDIVKILNHYEEVLEDLDEKGAFTEVKYDYDEDEYGETVEQVIVSDTKYIDIEYFARMKAKLDDLQSEQIKEMQEHQEAMLVADDTIKMLEKALELACDDIWAMSIWENTKEEVIADSIEFYKTKAKEMKSE